MVFLEGSSYELLPFVDLRNFLETRNQINQSLIGPTQSLSEIAYLPEVSVFVGGAWLQVSFAINSLKVGDRCLQFCTITWCTGLIRSF